MLHVGLAVLEIPRPDDDQVAFANPLAAAHLSGNARKAHFTVCAKDVDTTTTEDLFGQREHLVDLRIGHLDTDAPDAGVAFNGLKSSELFLVDLFLTSSSHRLRPFDRADDPSSIPPQWGAHLSRAAAASRQTSMSGSPQMPNPTVPTKQRPMATVVNTVFGTGRSRPTAGASKNITTPMRR